MDIRTLFVMTVVNGLLLGVAQLIVWRTHRQYPSLLQWGIANFVGAAGSLLIAARGQIPDWASIALGNSLITAWLLLLWDGNRRFEDQRLPPICMAGGPASVFLVMFWPPIGDNLAIRTMLIAGLTGLLLTLATNDLWKAQQREPLAMRRFLIAVFAIAAAPCFVRLALSAGLDPQGDFMASGPVQMAMMLHMNLFILAWNIGGLLMLNERMQNILSRAATLDMLTGLPNGTEFLVRAERLLMRARADGHAVALLMIGLRHLRSYNSRLGNPGAENSIRTVAETLTAQLRPNELIAHLGGEQFAVLLDNCSPEQAQAISKRISDAVGERNIHHPGTPRGVAQTLIGICAGPAATQGSARAMIEYADAALLRVSQSGDLRVSSFLAPVNLKHSAV